MARRKKEEQEQQQEEEGGGRRRGRRRVGAEEVQVQQMLPWTCLDWTSGLGGFSLWSNIRTQTLSMLNRVGLSSVSHSWGTI